MINNYNTFRDAVESDGNCAISNPTWVCVISG